MPMVPKCTSAASAIRMAKRACRVGGGGNACGPRNVSSMLSAPVPVTILVSFHPRSPIPVPTVGQAQQFCRRHLDQRQRLPTFGNQSIVRVPQDRKSTRLNSSHMSISYAVFCLKKKNRDQAGVCEDGTIGEGHRQA